ncbi:MAG: response regulator [Acidobacteriota bacterium]|nr:response regulator [Acidobacteriota bacterium]
MNYKVLIVDDEPANIRLLERLFRHDYQVLSALSGREALEILVRHEVALIITDQRMPGMTGVELLKRAAEMRPHTMRIILTGYTDVNTLVDALNSGVVYKYVTKPWNNADLKQTATRALEFYEINKRQHELSRQYERLSQTLAKTEQGFTRFIADSKNFRDAAAHGHARRTSGYATAIGYRLGIEREELDKLSLAAFFHDLGGSPNDTLQKDVSAESRVAEFYCERSAFLLANARHLSHLEPVIRHYRENFDGSGYPRGLIGEQIPLHSRIIAVAEAYDEMTRFSFSRKALSHGEAIVRLQKVAGSRFDPAVVTTLCEMETFGKIRQTIERDLNEMPLLTEQIFEETSGISSSEMLRRIKTEPWLAMQVLREANALHESEPTAQLLTAATRLGEQKLHLLLEKYGSPVYDTAMQEWSEQALRCAVAAQMLAAHTDLMKPDEAYTLGLLYEIGAAFLTNLFPEEMSRLKRLDGEERFQKEIEIFTVESAQVSQWILEKCGFSENLTSGVVSDSRLMRFNSPEALLMSVANRIAGADEGYKVTVIDSLESDVLAILRLSRNDLNRIYECAAAVSGEILHAQREFLEFA